MEKNIDNSIDNENIDSEFKKNNDKKVGNSLDKDINIEDVVNKKINNDSDMKVRDVTSNVNVVSHKKKSTNEIGTRNVKKTKNVNNGNGNATVVLIVSILLSFICGSLAAYLIVSNSKVAAQSVVKNITTSELVETSISMSVDKVYPATVLVVTNKGTGTGFVYKIDENKKKAYIMTNNHVIDGATSIEVEFNDSSDRIKAELRGGDAFSDIAVLTIDAKDANGNVVDIGKTADLKLGDTVFTVGSPLGIDYKGTVTKGIVSGKNRLVDVSLTNSGTVDYYMDVMQVDAALNPGNSGGPLCDVSGKVVGVTTLKIIETPKSGTNIFGQSENLGVESMGFAILIEDALKYANEIVDNGRVIRPLVGITMYEDAKKEYYLRQNGVIIPDDVEIGAVIQTVEDGSPADKAKLKDFDIITKIAGKEVSGIADFRYELYKHEIGEKVELVYYRNGKEEKTIITLGENKG